MSKFKHLEHNLFKTLKITAGDLQLVTLSPKYVSKLATLLTEKPSWYSDRFGLDSAKACADMLFRVLAEYKRRMQHPLMVVKNGELAGITMIRRADDRNRCVELGGTWLAPAFWGTSVNPEIKLTLLESFFEQYECGSVYLTVASSNPRSIAALKKYGFQEDGCLRNRARYDDGSYDNVHYFSAIIEEWPPMKKDLIQLIESRQS